MFETIKISLVLDRDDESWIEQNRRGKERDRKRERENERESDKDRYRERSRAIW